MANKRTFDLDRLNRGFAMLQNGNLLDVTLGELTKDPGKHLKEWDVLSYILTGEVTYYSPAEEKIAEMIASFLK